MDIGLPILTKARKALKLDFTVIYRVNVVTAEYEIIRLLVENPEYAIGYKDFNELIDDYLANGVEKEFIGSFPGEEETHSDYPQTMRLADVAKYFETHTEPVQSYYHEKSGKWLKLIVTTEDNYSKEHPYVIYAIRECVDEIIEKTKNVIYNTATPKMYSIVVAIDHISHRYYNIYCEKEVGLREGSGSLDEFEDIMRSHIVSEDYVIFEELIYGVESELTGFIDREYRIESKDGEVHYINGFTTNITVPEGDRILFLARNIDESVASRNSLKNLNAKYDKTKNALYALGSTYFGIYYVNLETKRITTMRRGNDVRSIFDEDLLLDEIFERYINTLVHPENREELTKFLNIDNIRNSLPTKGERTFVEYQRSFGSVYKWVRLYFQATHCVEGKAVNIIMAFRDITEDKELEFKHQKDLNDALVSAKLASEAKSRFLANMSHDIRTPLNAIMGMAKIAQSRLDDKEKTMECLKNIETSSKHLTSLINDILDMSYIESGRFELKPEKFKLNEMLDSVVTIAREHFENKNQTFEVRLNNVTNVDVYGDRLRVQQIIINVLENSAKYTPNGGIIEMDISQDKSYDDHAVYTFVIKDTGKGMSKEFLSKLFMPFERERVENLVEGTGLGMAIVKHIVDLMDGDISVNSILDRGTEFRITLPMKIKQEEKKVVAQVNSDYACLKGKRVLVVDDNEINCTIACDYLEDIGVVSEVAINGKEAFNMISEGEKFDAVLMDVRMPIMNGYDATKLIRGIGNDYCKQLAIIAMTANAFDEDVQKSYQAGMNYHISKPLEPKELYDALNCLLS